MAVLCFVDVSVSEEKMVSQQILITVMTRIGVDKSTDHAKPHSIGFLPQCQHLFTIENTDSDLKVHTPHYAHELLVRVRLSFQNLIFLHLVFSLIT